MTRLILCCIALLAATRSAAQVPATNPPLSHSDSAKVRAYLDSAGKYGYGSYKSRKYMDSALAVEPWRPYWWQQQSGPLFKMRKYEMAMRNVDSAVKYDTKDHYYQEYRAFCQCIFQKNYKDAMADFRDVRVKNGNRYVMDHPYNFYIGLCYLQLDGFDSCKYLMKLCIDDQAKSLGEKWVHPLNWFYLGVAHLELSEYEQALESFDNCLKLYSNFSDAKYQKAVCLLDMHRYLEALAVLREAKSDLDQGYTINEDNAIYEKYPYQVSKHQITSQLEWLDEEMKKKQ